MPENKLGFGPAGVKPKDLTMPMNYANPPSPGVPTPEEEALVTQPLGTETNFLSLPLGLAARAFALPTMAKAEQASYQAAETAYRAERLAVAAKVPHQVVAVDHIEIDHALTSGTLADASFNVYGRVKDAFASLGNAVAQRTASPETLTKLIYKQGELADRTIASGIGGGHITEAVGREEGRAWFSALQELLAKVGQ
jgi:hypothetical protein